MDKEKNKEQFAGELEDVKASVQKWFEEKFKYAKGSWVEIEIEIKNVD